MPACTTLTIRTSVVADPAMLVRDRCIGTSRTTRQIPGRTPTHAVDADLPVSTGFTASTTMFGAALKIDASPAAIGGCRAWAIRHTTATCALFTTCTDLPATPAMIDVYIQIDTGPLAIHRACGAYATALDTVFAVRTGVVANAAVLVVLEQILASIAAKGVAIGTKARSVDAALALGTGFVVRARSKHNPSTSERDHGHPKPNQK